MPDAEQWRGRAMPEGGTNLTPDEWLVLCAYRDIRASGAGVLVVEIAGGACTKFECRTVHDARLLTTAMGLPSTLRD